MNILITDSQYGRLIGLLTELSPKSTGVKEFIKTVKDTPGLLKYLQFKTIKDLEEYITDGSYSDMTELKKDADTFHKKHK